MRSRAGIILLLGFFPVFMANAVLPLPSNLIDFSSQTGLMILQKNLNTGTLKLLEHFTTQQTSTYCSVASAVMILNAIQKSPPEDSKHPPFKYFTQDDFFTPEVIKIVSPKAVAQNGMTIKQLVATLNVYGAKATAYYASDLTLAKSRQILTNALSKQQLIIADVLRTGLKELGGGHFSPIAAYDKQTDRFLFLDVARYKYPPSWVTTTDLWTAMNTIDNDKSRGFIVINSTSS